MITVKGCGFGEARQFRNYAHVLREMAGGGDVASLSLGRGKWGPDWSAYGFVLSAEQLDMARRVLAWHQRRVHYVREVLPGWRVVNVLRYADNSVEHVQQATDGRKRVVLVTSPSGDACF